jgi:16S rRNA (uracil1498-N3)-methyltransferase
MTLDAEASRYVARVHRLGAGDQVLLFDPEHAKEAVATVIAVDRAGVRCRVERVRGAQIRALGSTTLVQAIGKGDKFDSIVRDATELGATRIVAAETSRSIVKLGDRAEERLKRWRRIAAEAARQSGRGDMPQIVGPLAWREALELASAPENTTAALMAGGQDATASEGTAPASGAATAPGQGALLLCLWERATAPIGPFLRERSAAQPLVFVVGPEGGLDEGEIEIAGQLGYAPVSLGPFILRTETVAAAVLGAALATKA